MKKLAKKLFSTILGVCFAIGFCLPFCSCSLLTEYETRYETEVSFFVNPKKEGDTEDGEYKVYGSYGNSAMTQMTGLLESDRFTLFFLQEQGLAPKEILEDGTENPAFEEWLKSYDYTRFFVGAKEGIEYSFASEIYEGETLKRSFIEVKISVKERELAEIFLAGVKKVVPPFVEENMLVPNGYIGTRCEKVSLFEEIKEVKTKKDKTFII